LPTIGYLHALSREINRDFLNAFQSGLSGGGFVEEKNVAIENRFAEAHFDRLPELANELVAKLVNLIATAGGTADAMFTNTRIKLTELAARYRIPDIYHRREFAAAGGLITYGASLTDANRQVGIYSAVFSKEKTSRSNYPKTDQVRVGDQS
jgi:hypothetical protein